MSIPPTHLEISQLSKMQRRLSAMTWAAVLLLSLRGLFVFYGMKDKGPLEQVITFATEPLVQMFQLRSLNSSNIPAMSVFSAAIVLLLASYVLQIGLKYIDALLASARIYMMRQVISVN